MHLLARAKINLSLGITGKLANGYHAVEMILQSLELADRIDLRLAETGIELSGDQPQIPWNEQNLAYQAAELLQTASGCSKGVKITIQKRIPSQAGLGGGSADAAAVLIGLNQLWGLAWPLAELQKLGLRLGSDIPFCLQGGCLLARGQGELLEPLPCRIKPVVLLVKPTEGISTAQAYQAYDWEPTLNQPDNRLLAQALAAGEGAKVGANLQNVLEAPALKLIPSLGQLKSLLQASGAWGSLMTGSGSCFYGLYPDQKTAEQAQSQVQTQLPQMQTYLTAFAGQGVIISGEGWLYA